MKKCKCLFLFAASMKIDESVDLTHLAPTSGDTCVPLIGGRCNPGHAYCSPQSSRLDLISWSSV